MTNFKPLGDRIAVKLLAHEEKIGSIIIPDTAKERPVQGEVVAVGKGSRDHGGNLIALEVAVGDIVLFGKWSGTEVKVDNHELLVMKESDVMGIITSAKKHK
jgi:chaperonin GroES